MTVGPARPDCRTLARTCSWRFADLPVRTKFMVTLGIPVLGMVLLIGKQVDRSIKRRDVMELHQRAVPAHRPVSPT